MPSDEATLQSFGKPVEFTTARGAIVRGHCPTLAEALELLDLMGQVGLKKPGATVALLRSFIAATAAGEARVSPMELVEEVVPHFLALTGLEIPSTSPEPVPTSPTGSTT